MVKSVTSMGLEVCISMAVPEKSVCALTRIVQCNSIPISRLCHTICIMIAGNTRSSCCRSHTYCRWPPCRVYDLPSRLLIWPHADSAANLVSNFRPSNLEQRSKPRRHIFHLSRSKSSFSDEPSNADADTDTALSALPPDHI